MRKAKFTYIGMCVDAFPPGSPRLLIVLYLTGNGESLLAFGWYNGREPTVNLTVLLVVVTGLTVALVMFGSCQ